MSLEKQHICPSLDEIIAAAKPGASKELRDTFKIRLQGCVPADDALAGAIKFLEDHNYNFDALYAFLESPVNFSDTKKKPGGIISIKKLSIAATIVIVLAGASWFYFFRDTPGKIITKAVFYEPGLPVFASSVQDNKEFHELMSAYRLGDAKTGLGYFHSLINKEPQNDTLNYYGGWLYYLNKQTDSAALSFEKATAVKSEIYQHKAQYMQAICLYLNNKKDEAKLIFENILQDNQNPYSENAMQLLADKRLW